MAKEWSIHNPSGNKRVVVTKELPGSLWKERLIRSDCRIEVCTSTDVLSADDIASAIGKRCDAVLGQLTEDWGDELFDVLKASGGTAYSNVAVGFNNVDVDAATQHGIPVGNTPGVLTETTAQMAVALTFAVARRTGEAERFLRAGKYKGWLMTLFLGELLWRKTVGVVGAGRIGAAYARMMVEGHKMNLVYYDIHPNTALEDYIAAYSEFPPSFYYSFTYDAVNLLLSAIEKVAVQEQDGTLHIGRQALREALYATANFDGLTGQLGCDTFGDCGVATLNIVQFSDADMNVEELRKNVVYTYTSNP